MSRLLVAQSWHVPRLRCWNLETAAAASRRCLKHEAIVFLGAIDSGNLQWNCFISIGSSPERLLLFLASEIRLGGLARK